MQGMWIANMIAQPDSGLSINLNTQAIPSPFVTLDSAQNYTLAPGVNYTTLTENQFASIQPISLPVLLQQQQQLQQQQELVSLTPLEMQQRQSLLRCRLCDSLSHTTEQCPQDFAKRTRSLDEEHVGNSSFNYKNQENQLSTMASAAFVNSMNSYQDQINACNVINNAISDNTNAIINNNINSVNSSNSKPTPGTNNVNSHCNSFASSGTTSVNNSFGVAPVSAAVPSIPPLVPIPFASSTSSSLVMSANSLITSAIPKDYNNNNNNNNNVVEPPPPPPQLMQIETNNYNNNNNNNMYNNSMTSNGTTSAAAATGTGTTAATSSSFSNSSSLTAAPSSLPLSSPSQTQSQEKFPERSQIPLVPLTPSTSFTSSQPLLFTQVVQHHFTGQEVIVPSSLNINSSAPPPPLPLPPPPPPPLPLPSNATSPFMNSTGNVNGTPQQHPFHVRGVCLVCGSPQHSREDCPQRMRKLECHQCHQLGHMMMHCPMTRCYNCGSYGHSSQVCHSKPHCFHCSHSGHRSMECPMRFKGRVCYQCNEPGHEAANCPQGQLCRMCHQSGHLVAHCPSVTCHTCHVKGHTAGVCDKVKCDKCNLTHSPSNCPLDAQHVLPTTANNNNNGEIITSTNTNNTANNNTEEKRNEHSTLRTDENNNTTNNNTTNTRINHENEKNKEEMNLEMEDLNVFAMADSSMKENEESLELSNDNIDIYYSQNTEEERKEGNTEVKVQDTNTEMLKTEENNTNASKHNDGSNLTISTQFADNEVDNNNNISNHNTSHDYNNSSTNTTSSLLTVQQTLYYVDDNNTTTTINNNNNNDRSSSSSDYYYDASNATRLSNNVSHMDHMHDVNNEEIHGVFSSTSSHCVPQLTVHSNLLSATSSLSTEKSNHSISLSAQSATFTNNSTPTTTATISLPSFSSSIVNPLASRVLFASTDENHEVELHSFWESAANLSVPLYVSNEGSLVLNKNGNHTTNNMNKRNNITINSSNSNNSGTSEENSGSGGSKSTNSSRNSKIKVGSLISSNPSSIKINEYHGSTRHGRVAVIIDGKYFERCIRHVHQVTEPEYYQRMVIILKCALEFIGDIFDKRACAFYYDTDPVSFSSFASTMMKDAERENALRSIALRKQFFTDEMNSGRSLPNVVSRLVGNLECKEGYTSTGEPSSVWVETGINVAVATRLFDLFDEHKQFQQIVLLCGDSNVYPSAHLCNMLRKCKSEYKNTTPVRVCGTSSTISHLYGQQQDLIDFMSHILLDRMYHTENGKTIQFPTSAVFR